MIYLGFAIAFIGGLAASVYLIINDHTYFAIFILLITASLSVSTSHKKGDTNGK